jgi:hypothetical protein
MVASSEDYVSFWFWEGCVAQGIRVKKVGLKGKGALG